MFIKATQLKEFIELHFKYIRWTVYFFHRTFQEDEIELNFIGYKSIVANFSTCVLVFCIVFVSTFHMLSKHILVPVTTIDKNTSKNK